MDTRPTYDEIPWQLIIPALQDEATPEEARLLGEWLAKSPTHSVLYQQLRQLWKEGVADYIVYRDADPEKAWAALEQRLPDPATGATPMVKHPAAGKEPPRMMRWLAAATLIMLLSGIGLWRYYKNEEPIQYATIAGEEKRIPLPDGSMMILQPQTRLQLPPSYNKTARTVVLVEGTASFDIAHDQRLPFIVDLGIASIKDIGTAFTVSRTADSITVAVTSGKIAFTGNGTVKELSAGGSLRLYTTAQHSGEIKVISDGNDLRFDNAALSEVADILNRRFGKTILLGDSTLALKRLTVHLDGESFDQCVKIICASLDLEAAPDSAGVVLSARPPSLRKK